jgi:hypothetical protein
MGRRRTRNRANNIKPKVEEVIIDPTRDEPKSLKSRFIMFWNSFSTFWKIIGVLFIIGGGILSIVQLYDRFFPPKEKSQKEEYDSETFVQGELYQLYFINSLIYFNFAVWQKHYHLQ